VLEWPEKNSCLRRGFALFVLLIGALGSVQAEQLPVKTYTTADGLLRDEVNRIKQDSRGFLWFCTNDGLSRFDGYNFTNYTTDDRLPHRSLI
jgi:ligand-binding sensor domain-containing protein